MISKVRCVSSERGAIQLLLESPIRDLLVVDLQSQNLVLDFERVFGRLAMHGH